MQNMIILSLAVCIFISITSISAMGAATPITGVTQQPDGVALSMRPGVMRLQVWTDNVIRVTYAPGPELPALKSLAVIAKPAAVKWQMRDSTDAVIVETPLLRARVDKKTGAVAFLDLNDKPILRETDDGKSFPAPTTQAVQGTAVRQAFVLPADEGIYGLGQHQQGYWNYRGRTVHLQQRNMEVGLPVLMSSKGYGVLWDNPAITDIAVGTAEQEQVLSWSSEVGKAIDYYFMYGPSADGVIKQYRTLTGDAPMMAKWVWGFMQCKQRYSRQDEVESVAKRFRDEKMPLDAIIQDWRYWAPGNDTWGSHTFDKTRYPDAEGMFKTLHDEHVHNLISVWPKFDEGSPNSNELIAAGAMFDPVIPYVFPAGRGQWYDPFADKGREIYWKQVSTQLFNKGVDGWWLDAPEPELSGKWGEFRTFRTSVGPGAEVFNAYPLMHSMGIYQGQRAQSSDKRVVILTRSAYAGQQRNSAITWSGDIAGTWNVLRNQVPAGLNFSVSGIPYWNTDIGGFGRNGGTGNGNGQDPRYQELFTRWFQFGAFCPMFRVHGDATNDGLGNGKEFWRFDAKTQDTWRKFVNLRYRLIPYIYSTSWQVTSNGYTMMRPLVMDFPNDPKVLSIGDQFFFGPDLMVNPVTAQGATSRNVYLPVKSAWYDFWTGKREAGGQQITAAAPIETMPLYVPAGSILPMGPIMQYIDEKPDAPVEIRVYRGADGSFTLYEDEGDSYRYEQGMYATVPLTWNESTSTLTIGARKGEFPGMRTNRTFHVVFVSEGHGAGVAETEKPDQLVPYTGLAVTVKPQG